MKDDNLVSEINTVEFEEPMETVDLNDVPIFSVGKWEGKGSNPGGDNITGKTLKQWVSTFQSIGSKIKPRLRLSHDLSKSSSALGMASIGWITGLRTDGETLFANFKSIPKKIYNLIQAKAYGRFSPGVFKKININGQDYEGVLEHVALLGAALPANIDLDGFIDLYYENENIDYNDICTYENYRGDIMDFEAKLKELEAKFELQKKEFEIKEKEYTDNIGLVETEKNEAIKKFEDVTFESKKQKVVSFLDSQVEKKKITPAQKASYEKLLIPDDNKIEFAAAIDIVKEIIDNSVTDLPTDEQSLAGDTANTAYSNSQEPEEKDLDLEIKEYMKTNNITDYGDAYDAVTYQKNLEKQEGENVS